MHKCKCKNVHNSKKIKNIKKWCMQMKWTSESVKSAFQETYFPESLRCQGCQTPLGPSWGSWRDDAPHWPRAADIVLLSLSLCLMGTEIWLQVFICMLISKPVKRIGESGVSWATLHFYCHVTMHFGSIHHFCQTVKKRNTWEEWKEPVYFNSFCLVKVKL